MIKVEDVTIAYGKKQVLNHIHFQIKKGDVVGLLGKNGEGKSTTMNILTGYLSPDEGKVWISDIDMGKDPKSAKKKIGYLPEKPPVYKDMKVIEYLQFVAELKNVKPVDEEVKRVMVLLDLWDRRYDYIKVLSKGWQQRVGFAQCLIGDPEIFILDEPLVGLDPKESKIIRNLILELSKEHTILISSHILSEIEELCNQIMILKDGQMILDDSLQHAKNHKTNHQYKLTVKGDKDAILQLLNHSDLLSDVQYIKEEEQGVHRFVVCAGQKQDIRDNLFGLLVGKKYSVYGIEHFENTLEDVFMEYSGKEEAGC